MLTTRAVAATMRAPYADVRVQSATLANLAVYAGLTPVGATLAALPRLGRRRTSATTPRAPPASAATASSSCPTTPPPTTSTSTRSPASSSANGPRS